MMGRGTRAELGQLEATVLAVVAAADGPVTVGMVQVRLPGSPAYTTVMSTLVRLTAKGALTRKLQGRAYRYELAAPEEAIDDALAARRMHQLMGRRGTHRNAVLARFVAELDPDEERLLAELISRSPEPDRFEGT